MSIEDYNDRLLSRDEYFEYLKELETLPPEYCAFCDNKGNVTLKDFTFWNLIVCKAPYWRYHLMLTPKRHFKQFTDMEVKEAEEFLFALQYTTDTLIAAGLKNSDGTEIDRYLYFWRFRQNSFDPVNNVAKPDHFHFHIVPEKEHLWAPILDENACDFDVEQLKSLFIEPQNL